MPNWCSNHLNISGDEKSISMFKKAARGSHAGYNQEYGYDIDTRSWPIYDDVRVKALTKNPAPNQESVHDFCMNALYPVPSDFRRFPFDDGLARKLGDMADEKREFGGYTWQVENWGCKWDVEGELVGEENTFLQYRFDSPWSPPVDFFEKISSEWPNLTFELEYCEPGMAFAGRSTFTNGEYSEVDLPMSYFGEDEDDEDYE